jgi:uncharacterized protein YegJ (DUF2314 family)
MSYARKTTLYIQDDALEDYDFLRNHMHKMGSTINVLLNAMIKEAAENFRTMGLGGENDPGDITLRQMMEMAEQLFKKP